MRIYYPVFSPRWFYYWTPVRIPIPLVKACSAAKNWIRLSVQFSHQGSDHTRRRLIGFTYTTSVTNGTNLVTPNTGLVGDINDPVLETSRLPFGRVVYNPNQSVPSFKGMTLDSSVLVIGYDTLGFMAIKSKSQLNYSGHRRRLWWCRYHLYFQIVGSKTLT